MVRRSSLIIAASLAVLSTYDPGVVCFAAAAPAAPAAPPFEDRFERPRFLKREIHRYVFANTTTTPQAQTPTDDQTPTPISVTPEVTPTTTDQSPAQIAASVSAASLASAEASWSAIHPGVPFGADVADSTSSSNPPPSQASGGQGTTPSESSPPASSPQPPDHGIGKSASPSLPLGSKPNEPSGPAPGPSNTGSEGNTGGNQPPTTPGPTTHQTPPPPLVTPVESDGSHTIVPPPSTGQQQVAGHQGSSQSILDGSPTIAPPASTGKQQAAGHQSSSQSIPGLVIPIESDGSHTIAVAPPTSPIVGPPPSNTPPNRPDQSDSFVQTASPAPQGVSAGSTPTQTADSSGKPKFPLPGNTDSLINALTSALAVSSAPVDLQSDVSSAVPIIIGSSTNADGVVAQITASTPAESAAGHPLLGPSNSDDRIIPITAPPATKFGNPQNGANAVQGTGSLTESNSNVVLGTGSAPEASGTGVPAVVGSATNSLDQVVPITTPPSSEGTNAPAIVGSSTNSLGQVVPFSSVPASGAASPLVGSSTNSLGQVVPVTSSPILPGTNDRFAQQSAAQSVSGSQPSVSAAPNAVDSQSTPQTGVEASAPAGSVTPVGPTAASPPPTTAGAPGTSTPSAAPIPIATASQTYNTKQNAPLTQQPTAYDSMTSQIVASSIEVASSSAPVATTGSSETGMPSGVPLVLYPPTGPVNRPENTELIQIGFLYPLNYDFVWQHQESQRQIFTYLPIGIAYGLDIDHLNVTMQTLRAWDTTQDLHYITTLALAWIPSQLVDSLGLILHTQAEKFYHNPDPAVRTLLSMINPALPIRADNATDGGIDTGVGASPSGTGTATGQGTIASGLSNSSPVKAPSVAIGVGVVFGAAAYGAAMFFVARRYKRRRQSHLRSPSMYSSPVMSHHGADPAAGAALMSGGMGERSISPYYDNDRGPSRGSGRSGSSAGRQQISAPVMAENSLGWN